MWKKIAVILLLLVTEQVLAEYSCSVMPQYDVIIDEKSVQLIAEKDNLQISPTGEVTHNGKELTLNAAKRQQARSYQHALRQDLSWIDKEAHRHLALASGMLDKVIVEQLGADSQVRDRLKQLDNQLSKQMERIIEHSGKNGLVFHHQAIGQVEQEGQRLAQNALGGMLQDGLNEMSLNQLTTNKNNNPLQALVSNLGGLQQAITKAWNAQEKEFQRFGDEVCRRVSALEVQRQTLWRDLPQ